MNKAKTRLSLALLVLLALGLEGKLLAADTVTETQAPASLPSAFPLWLQNPWTGETRLTTVRQPDTSLWNDKRIADYHSALQVETAPPLGVLTIERLNIQAPVYNGASELILDRGLGRIPGMARIGEDGNLGISGHRDGFFRGLMHIETGDRIMLRLPDGVELYTVDSIRIVDKHDHAILAENSGKQLTLVTCYPFYHVGHAPQRYIVHASPQAQDDTLATASAD